MYRIESKTSALFFDYALRYFVWFVLFFALLLFLNSSKLIYSIDPNYFFLAIKLVFIIGLLGLTFMEYYDSSITISHDEFKIEKGISIFKSSYSFRKEDVISVVMYSDQDDPFYFRFLGIFFPMYSYKWLKVSTDSKDYKFYFFGVEFDYYENPKPYFEDIYVYLKALDYPAEWSNTKHLWPGLEEQVKKVKAAI